MRLFIKWLRCRLADMTDEYIELNKRLSQTDELYAQTFEYACLTLRCQMIKLKLDLIEQMKEAINYVLSRL